MAAPLRRPLPTPRQAPVSAADLVRRPAPVAPARALSAPPVRPSTSASFDDAVRLLRVAAVAHAIGEPLDARLAPLLQGRLAVLPRTVESAADRTMNDVVRDLLGRGWTPHDLYSFAFRRLNGARLAYVVDALAATAAPSVDVPWLAELREMDAHVWWSRSAPHLGQWARRHHLSRADALRAAVEVLSLFCFLPRTDEVVQEVPPTPALPPVRRASFPVSPVSPTQLLRSLLRLMLRPHWAASRRD